MGPVKNNIERSIIVAIVLGTLVLLCIFYLLKSYPGAGIKVMYHIKSGKNDSLPKMRGLVGWLNSARKYFGPKRSFLHWVNSKPEMDDPAFVDFVRDTFLFPANNKPYNLKNGSILNPSGAQLTRILPLLNATNISKQPFYVEAGAFDGEFLSNTLFLERVLGWNGLLVEAGVPAFEKLRGKNRKAWLSNACLSNKRFPIQTTFHTSKVGYLNGLNARNYWGINGTVQVQCVPLYTILLALNQTVIDFFSLDVEGSELDILRTIPFDKVVIKVLVVEIGHIKEGPAGLITFMTQNGYKMAGHILSQYANDIIYTHD